MDPGAVEGPFEAFKQEYEGLDREFEGSGLDPSIVKRLTDDPRREETRRLRRTCGNREEAESRSYGPSTADQFP